MYTQVADGLVKAVPGLTCSSAEDAEGNWNACVYPSGCSKVKNVEDNIYLQFNSDSQFLMPI